VSEEAADLEDARIPVPAIVRIASDELFHGGREVVIIHRGSEYRLHITKTDKLILTK
jgi:hemin uptake protein HemP